MLTRSAITKSLCAKHGKQRRESKAGRSLQERSPVDLILQLE
jgi:hypothetical protein